MESAATLQKRLPHIDLLKCLAIYFVLIFHGTLYRYQVQPDMTAVQLLRFFFRTILSTCVPMFFFVNGYLLLNRPMDLGRHTRRTVRLILQTFFWTVFLLLILQPYYQEYFTWEELKDQIPVLKMDWNNQLWFLEDLIAIYLLFPLLKRTWDADKKSFCWITGVVMFLCFGNSLLNLGMTLFNLFVKREFYLYENGLPIFFNYNPFGVRLTMGLAYFCLGGIAGKMESHLRSIPAKWRNLAAVIGLALNCFVLGMLGWRFSLYLGSTWDVVWNGYGTVFTLGNVVSLYLLSMNVKKERPLLRSIAGNTLGIYLTHDLIQKLIVKSVKQLPFMRSLTGTLIYAAALLLICLAVCRLLKKIPLVKHLVS